MTSPMSSLLSHIASCLCGSEYHGGTDIMSEKADAYVEILITG